MTIFLYFLKQETKNSIKIFFEIISDNNLKKDFLEMDRSIFTNVSQDEYWNLKSYFGAEVHPLVTSGFLNQFTLNELRTADMTKNIFSFFDMANDFDRSSLDRIRESHENRQMTLVVNTKLYRKQSLGAINHLDLAFHLTLDETEKNSLLDFLSRNAKSV